MTFGRCAYSPTRAIQDLANARLLVGKRLRLLSHQQYYFNGDKEPSDTGPLEWHYGDQVVSMYLLSDGECVGADPLPFETPEAFELESGAICSWKNEDLLAGLSAVHLVGQLIHEIEGIVDTRSHHAPRLVGFQITFETGDFLVFLNQGDEGVVLVNQFPAAIIGVQTQRVTTLG